MLSLVQKVKAANSEIVPIVSTNELVIGVRYLIIRVIILDTKYGEAVKLRLQGDDGRIFEIYVPKLYVKLFIETIFPSGQNIYLILKERRGRQAIIDLDRK